MLGIRAYRVALLVCAASGCTEAAAPSATEAAPPTCESGQFALPDASCIRPGIPSDGCAQGFVHDDEYGCEPTLPADPCPTGLMAVPGDIACHPVMSCGTTKWGNIPDEPETQYVDASYAPLDSDGSAAKPWRTIQAGIDAAVDGAIVAVAAGTYAEDVFIEDRSVRLWGVCPQNVEIIGTGAVPGAVSIVPGASGAKAASTTIRGLAVAPVDAGVLVDGVEDVLLDHVWIHDGSSHGIHAEGTAGPTAITVRSSLVERNTEAGLFVNAADAIVDASVFRATRRNDIGQGAGIAATNLSGPTSVEVRGSLIEQNAAFGIVIGGASATIDATVVRDTATGTSVTGTGISVYESSATARIRGSLIERTEGIGALVWTEAKADLENTVIRDTHPDAHDPSGAGMVVQEDASGRGASATVRGSLIERNSLAGVFASGSDADLDTTVVRGTAAGAIEQQGVGVVGQHGANGGGPARIDVVGSLVDDNIGTGVIAAGSNILISNSIVSNTQPDANGVGGSGIYAHALPNVGPSDLTVRNAVVTQNHSGGIGVQNSTATVSACIVRDTLENGVGAYGDGLFADDAGAETKLFIDSTRIEDSARAGVSNFGAYVSVTSSTIRCAAFALDGEQAFGAGFTFQDGGGNECGCPTAQGTCRALSSGLEPPAPLEQSMP